MTQSDSFIDEVTEEVRRDRLFRLMRRYGWIAVLIVLLIVGAAAWREWSIARSRAAAEALGDRILAALEEPDGAARTEALQAIDAKGDARALVALLIGAEDGPAAGDALRRIAEDETLPLYYTQLAMLKLMMLPGQGFSAQERLDALGPLAEPGRPYRALALEQMALAEIEAGDPEKAISYLRTVIEGAEASPGLRQRASQLMVALGGSPDAG